MAIGKFPYLSVSIVSYCILCLYGVCVCVCVYMCTCIYVCFFFVYCVVEISDAVIFVYISYFIGQHKNCLHAGQLPF